MTGGLENLEVMEYPGRLIIAGKSEDGVDVVVYGLSGRSASSQARRLKANDKGSKISIDVTDPEQLAKGNPALLVYDAILRDSGTGALIASNGAQTGLLLSTFRFMGQMERMGYDIRNAIPSSFARPNYIEGTDIDMSAYEPDSPIFTPRVSAIALDGEAMLAVVKRGNDGEPVKCYYEVQLQPEKGFMVATYDGPNPPKPGIVPSFKGEPRHVRLVGSPENIASTVYEAIGDFRVSAACMTSDGKLAIKNLHGGCE